MAEPTLTDRVEILEEKVQELTTLPKRVEAVESQVLLLRDEMRGEFSTVRQEFRSQTTAFREEVRREFRQVRQEIREGDEETRRYMRVLHEEVITRIATLAEGRDRT